MAPFRWLDFLPRTARSAGSTDPSQASTAQSRLAQALSLLWLPVIGGSFWLATGWLNQQVFGQPKATPNQVVLPNSQSVELSLQLTVVSIDVEIDRDEGNSEVTVQARGATLRGLAFEYPLTEYDDLEEAIAEELKLPRSSVRELVRYRLD